MLLIEVLLQCDIALCVISIHRLLQHSFRAGYCQEHLRRTVSFIVDRFIPLCYMVVYNTIPQYYTMLHNYYTITTQLLHNYYTITTQSNATQRNATQRNATQRNATQRNATQRNATQRNATQRNATQRNATQRNATQRNATQRNATQRNATQRNATQRNATQHQYKDDIHALAFLFVELLRGHVITTQSSPFTCVSSVCSSRCRLWPPNRCPSFLLAVLPSFHTMLTHCQLCLFAGVLLIFSLHFPSYY